MTQTYSYPVVTTPAPVGGATAANQVLEIAALNSIDGKLTNPLPVSGTVAVSSVAGSVAVTGTFFQATQPVSGTVTADAGTGTFAVSAASLPLPTGASTAAKQPALGTAGTASADVLTVQGIASMTALKVDGSAVTQPVSGTVTISALTNSSVVKAQLQDNAGTAITLGSKVSASSVPVVIASDQGAVPASQSGTWTVQPGNTANTTAWLVAQSTAAATFQDGAIAFGSLTTSFATVITAGGALNVVQMRNNTNAVVVVSLDSGSTTAYTLDPGDQISVDLKDNGLSIANATTLQAKYSGTAPTVGSIRINAVR
jgi:hypothetical protein